MTIRWPNLVVMNSRSSWMTSEIQLKPFALQNEFKRELAIPFVVNKQKIVLSANIGIASSTSPHTQAEDLVRDADIPMYRVKRAGKARCEVSGHGNACECSEAFEAGDRPPQGPRLRGIPPKWSCSQKQTSCFHTVCVPERLSGTAHHAGGRDICLDLPYICPLRSLRGCSLNQRFPLSSAFLYTTCSSPDLAFNQCSRSFNGQWAFFLRAEACKRRLRLFW